MNQRNHRRPQDLARDAGGAVYVEFLIAFIPFFVMVLGMMQIALMYSAHLIVQHAAFSAARAAMVVFPDCPDRYGGAAVNQVNGGGRGDDPISALTSLFPGGGGGSLPGIPSGGSRSGGGARLNAVHFAANFPLVATSPSLDEITHNYNAREQSVVDAIGGGMNPAARLALGAVGYNQAALAVNFPRQTRSRTMRDNWGARDLVTARVTYLFHCGVPIVNKIACDDALQLYSGLPIRQLQNAADTLRSGRASIGEINAVMNSVRAAQDRLSVARPALQDELQGSPIGYGGSAILLAVSRGNFSVLRAEATMPNQGISRRIAGECYTSSRAR